MKSCGNCEHWTKGNNKYRGVHVGVCALGFYAIFMTTNKNEPYRLEKAVTLDDGNVACGKWIKVVAS